MDGSTTRTMPGPSPARPPPRPPASSAEDGRREGSALEVVHAAVPGRVRFQIDTLRNHEALGTALRDRLAREPDIRQVTVRTLTGSVLVRFDPELEPELIRARLEACLSSLDISLDSATSDELAAHTRARRSRLTALALVMQGKHAAAPAPLPSRSAPTRTPAPGAPPIEQPAWHTLEIDEVIRRCDTTLPTGMALEAAEQRLRLEGPNRLTSAPPRGFLELVTGQLKSLPVALLAGSAALSAVTGGVADAVVILSVIGLNAVIGGSTELWSERTISALTRFPLPRVAVQRDGRRREIAAEEVVRGDVLLLARGGFVAADARLLEAEDLTVDESALTGESVPVEKNLPAIEEPVLPLAERRNMVYRGTVVTGGAGRAVVVATGERTEVGRIQALITAAAPPMTPIQRQLELLGRQLAGLTGLVSGTVFLIGLARGYRPLELFRTVVSLAVAAVPEGLPTVATTTLAYGVRQLRREQVLVRRLDAVETLGAVQVLCLDKTGTITINRMSVVSIFSNRRLMPVEAGRIRDGDGELDPRDVTPLRRLLEMVVLCSEAEIETDPRTGEPRPSGSPTEVALIRLATDAGIDAAVLRNRHPRMEIRYRTEQHMYMVTRHRRGTRGQLLAIKGRPDEVLELCTRVQLDGRRRPLTDRDRDEIRTQNERMAGRALRVLGVAFLETTSGTPRLEDGLTWLGLVGMRDPPREGMREILQQLREAGIRTLMITGDQSATASSIARELELAGDEELTILDSTRLETLDPALLSALVPHVHVFSRVSPHHKLRIVSALQHNGAIVAMTGDGINDGPALRAANVGVAMGREGSEVAREVADALIADDRVQRLLTMISNGRTTYDDIRRAVHFIMSTNLSEILFTVICIGSGLGMPLGPRQLLWLNLMTDVFPELSLSVEPPHADVLKRAPRDPSKPLLHAEELRRISREAGVITAATLGAYLYGRRAYGPGARADTLAFMSLTSAQLLHTISARSAHHSLFDAGRLPPNRSVTEAIVGGVLLQFASELITGLRLALGNAPLGGRDVLVCAGAASISLVLNELLKRARLGLPETP